MLSILLKAERERAKVARISLATLLALVLLSSILPFSALASHGCKMVCCAGKLSHGAESCSVSFAGENRAEAPDHQGLEHSGQSDILHKGALSSSSGEEAPQTISLVSKAIAAPCAIDCACAASATTQLPRPREETAALSDADNFRPPMLLIFSESFSKFFLPSAGLRQQTRPRAPPGSLINTQA